MVLTVIVTLHDIQQYSVVPYVLSIEFPSFLFLAPISTSYLLSFQVHWLLSGGVVGVGVEFVVVVGFIRCHWWMVDGGLEVTDGGKWSFLSFRVFLNLLYEYESINRNWWKNECVDNSV